MTALITLDGTIRPLNPGILYAQVKDNPFLPKDFWQKCNSYANPLGVTVGEAWLLLLKSDVTTLEEQGAQEHYIDFKSSAATDQQQRVAGLYFDRAMCMTPGAPDDPNAAYLAYFVDKRGVMKNAYVGCRGTPSSFDNASSFTQGRAVTSGCFNVPRETMPGSTGIDLFYTGTLKDNSGTLEVWTWATAWTELWGYLPSTYAGSVPSLPSSPHGVPCNLEYSGLPVLQAIEHFLGLNYFALSYDPGSGSFSVIRTGDIQTDLATFQTKVLNEGRLLFDYAPVESQMAHPQNFVSVFHRQNTHYWPLPFVRHHLPSGSLVTGVDSVYFSTGHHTQGWSYGAEVAPFRDTNKALYDDMVAFTSDEVGPILNEDNADTMGANFGMRERSLERVGQHSFTIRRSDTYFGQIWSGVVKATTGSQVKLVRWRDYGEADAALVTEAWSFPGLPTCAELEAKNPLCCQRSGLAGEETRKRDTRAARFQGPVVQLFFGKTDGTLSPEGYCNFRLWNWDGTEMVSPAGNPVYAEVSTLADRVIYDWLQDASEGVGSTTNSITSGTKAIIGWIKDSDTYFVVNWMRPYKRSANQAAVTLGNTNGAIGGLSVSAGYVQAEIQAIRDATETLADDVRALANLIQGTDAIRQVLIAAGLMKGAA